MHYWFGGMKEKIKHYIENCVKCIMHTEQPRVARTLHMIPKRPVPLDTVHIDHYGPLANVISKKKYILGVTDGFTKFTKLYAVNIASAKEVIESLKKYFSYYGRPRRLISDRATCFTGQEFTDFLRENNIETVRVATAAPHANGQIERINRVLTPMLGKLTEMKNQADWAKMLDKAEFALNNSVSAATKTTASELFFGVKQRGPVVDWLTEYVEDHVEEKIRDLTKSRAKASEEIEAAQRKNADYHAANNKPANQFEKGDLVVIKNVDTTIGTNKKLNPKYRGPYQIEKVLPNDRYVVSDIENCQITQVPYHGILEASRIKKWIRL